MNEFMGFANFFYDFLPSPDSELSLYPYVGIGIGYQNSLIQLPGTRLKFGPISRH